MKLPTLYGVSSNGSIKEWSVQTIGDSIHVSHGKQGGKMQTKVSYAKGKNLGKANETTPHEQALSEAQSKWNKQIDNDYRESVDELEESTLPPLAKKYQDFGSSLGEEYDVLFKMDGVRCTTFYKNGVTTFQSRGGKPYPVIQTIADDLYNRVWRSWPDKVLDGELYCHNIPLEDIVSAVKKPNKDTPRIYFAVFDTYDPEKPQMVWEDRYTEYRALIGDDETNDRVKSVYAQRVTSEDQMLKIHDRAVGHGYEGVVLRKLDGVFEFGHRTATFQKYKVPLDMEFKVLRFDIDKNGCAIPWCYIDNQTCYDRDEFKAPLIGTREFQQEVAKNQEKYVGKYLKVVFEAYSKYGVPAKPKGHVFRELDKDGNPTE